MRKFFQTQWHDIAFSSFHSINSKSLPSSEFYNEFYSYLFKRYASYDKLDWHWRRNKDEIADWLAAYLKDGDRILSIGCGLGYVESRLCQCDRIELHVQDYATNALNWLRQVLPANKIHDAKEMFGDSNIGKFNLIYLLAVDYAISTNELISFLRKSRELLVDGGQLIMISESFLEGYTGRQFVYKTKDFLFWFLCTIGIRKSGQFWGWMRTKQEYHSIMSLAGLNNVTDGFIETLHQRKYWIKGMAQ